MDVARKIANLPHFHHYHCRHFLFHRHRGRIDFRTIAGLIDHSDGGMLVAKGDSQISEEIGNSEVAFYQQVNWYARRELNPQPLAPEANALSN